MSYEPVKQIRVEPSTSYEQHVETLRLAETIFDVQFHPGHEKQKVHDAVLVLNGDEVLAQPSSTGGKPVQVWTASGNREPCPESIRFSQSSVLDPVLQGRQMREKNPPMAGELRVQQGEEVVALAGDQPIWTCRRSEYSYVERIAFSFGELARIQSFRQEMRGWRFIRFLPLYLFLKRICCEDQWQNLGLQASLLLDDPNLHSGSYGFVNYRRLLTDAKKHHYHVSIATVPIDQWYVNSNVAAMFRDNPEQLSLAFHGNNHVKHELDRAKNEEIALRMMAQALGRVERMEKRTGLHVDRVMSAPHGICSRNIVEAMMSVKFRGMISWVPIPWERDEPEDPTCGWWNTQFVNGGFPTMARCSLPHCLSHSSYEDDLVFMALRGRPIVITGHHWDLCDPSALNEMARKVNAIGQVNWCSLEKILERQYRARIAGETLHVKMHSDFVTVEIPEGASSIVVDRSPGLDPNAPIEMQCRGSTQEVVYGEKISLDEDRKTGGLPVKLVVLRDGRLDYQSIPHPWFSPYAHVRRILVFARDRVVHPIRHQMKILARGKSSTSGSTVTP